MNLGELAKKFELSANYFFVLRCNNKKKFNMIFKTENEYKYEDVINYIDYIKGLIADMENILYRFEDYENLYAKILIEHGLSENKTNLSMVMRSHEYSIFRIRDFEDYLTTTIEQVESWEKIIKVLKHYEVEYEK